jgi:hypothetical protein
MITLLTSELNRINQGCGEYVYTNGSGSINCGSYYEFDKISKKVYCSDCRKEKETLKKVSLMWADKMLERIDNIKYATSIPSVKVEEECDEVIMELKGIKSLMEKA